MLEPFAANMPDADLCFYLHTASRRGLLNEQLLPSIYAAKVTRWVVSQWIPLPTVLVRLIAEMASIGKPGEAR